MILGLTRLTAREVLARKIEAKMQLMEIGSTSRFFDSFSFNVMHSPEPPIPKTNPRNRPILNSIYIYIPTEHRAAPLIYPNSSSRFSLFSSSSSYRNSFLSLRYFVEHLVGGTKILPRRKKNSPDKILGCQRLYAVHA